MNFVLGRSFGRAVARLRQHPSQEQLLSNGAARLRSSARFKYQDDLQLRASERIFDPQRSLTHRWYRPLCFPLHGGSHTHSHLPVLLCQSPQVTAFDASCSNAKSFFPYNRRPRTGLVVGVSFMKEKGHRTSLSIFLSAISGAAEPGCGLG